MDKKGKVDCKYWDKCYQKNPEHHKKYSHPPSIQVTKVSDSSSLNVADHTKNNTKRSPSPQLKVSDSKRKRTSLSPTSTTRSPSSPREQSTSPTKMDKTDKSPTSSPKEIPKSPTTDPKSSNSSSSTDSNIVKPKAQNKEVSTSNETNKETIEKNESGNNEISSSTNTTNDQNQAEFDITEEYNEVMKNVSGKNYFEIFQRRVKYSQKAEYLELLKTPEFIRHKFLVEMPTDFYKFWDFCVSIAEKQNKKNPQEIFHGFGLLLIGPFDYLSGLFNNEKIHEPANYLRHWRFYYDPPEFQTVFVKMKSCQHYGYWRDDPKDKENLLMARNDADKGCEFEFIGGNCFETVLYYLNKDCPVTPFNQKQITNMKKSIQEYAEQSDIPLDSLESMKKKRDKNVVCKTFHKAGLVVPFNRKTELGYRALIESDAKIKTILSQLDEANGDKNVIENVIELLQPIITAANIAVDECDFGTSVELGIDLFCSGHKELHNIIRLLLVSGYSMLQRPQFIAIMKAHLEDRKKGYKLSIFE